MLTEYPSSVLRQQINIEACAVWNTVSAIGLPLPGSMLPLNAGLSSSVEQNFPKNLRHAFHALALNEERTHFKAVLWSSPPPTKKQSLKQCWFVGSHSDVRGGSKDQTLSTISFLWMVAQLQNGTGLSFNTATLRTMLPEPELKHTLETSLAANYSVLCGVSDVLPEKHRLRFEKLGKNCSRHS